MILTPPVPQIPAGLVQIQTVVVFGDSLSDIGKKWTTPVGIVARALGQICVSPTGRFSDCRNWTDHMFEQASGLSLVVDDPNSSKDWSKKHMALNDDCWAWSDVRKSGRNFRYVNYAEGGACGWTPESKGPFLGTFQEQVDQFERDCQSQQRSFNLGNTLFIVWFGANDLYTAGRAAQEMPRVAEEIAWVQRCRLDVLAATFDGSAYFIFVELAEPSTIVKYAMRLEKEKRKYLDALKRYAPAGPNKDLIQRNDKCFKKELAALAVQQQEMANLLLGVTSFNARLKNIASRKNDRVVEIGSYFTEVFISKLLERKPFLKEGPAERKATFRTALEHDELRKTKEFESHITTKDRMHPTDEVYRLIWKRIRKEIRNAGYTFGFVNIRPING